MEAAPRRPLQGNAGTSKEPGPRHRLPSDRNDGRSEAILGRSWLLPLPLTGEDGETGLLPGQAYEGAAFCEARVVAVTWQSVPGSWLFGGAGVALQWSPQWIAIANPEGVVMGAASTSEVEDLFFCSDDG